MAETILYSVATSLINSLASAALREFARINGVMDEFERLKNTVESIRAVLLDAEEKQEQSHAVQNWVRRLKDVLSPADDLLDEFVIQDMIQKRDEPHQNKVKKVLNPFSPNKFAFRHNMANEIEKIQKMFDDVVRDMTGLNLNPKVGVVEKTNSEWRETSSCVIESDIIGREGDKEKIVNLLRQPHEDQNVSLVAIVGIGGLGKTALAQLVYNDGEVRKIFEKFMWVCVSDNFDVKTILKNMLKSLLPKEKIDDTLTLDNLQTMLRDNLNGKRYLLVLDDVWNESSEKWDKLRTYLMCGARGSKVVVTTRSRIVADRMGVKDPYVLSGLIPEKSWSLLKKIAFGDDTIRVDQNIESIGKKIAKKSNGVPLAIRSLGNILQGKSEEKEWNDVLRGDFWKLCEDEDSILPVLKLSYNNLSPQQRQCFAYCSLFPKDWEFQKDELVQMWMAHGYLDCPVEGKCIEDVGNQFIHIFLMKSFFQEPKRKEDGDLIGFKMHDLMHDLAKQVAGDDCCYLDNNAKGFRGRPVHVWVEFDAFYLLESLDASRLRTLIVLSFNDDDLLDREKQSLISRFKYLRVLKLCDDLCIDLYVSIEKLNHLRFLKFSLVSTLKKFHKSIENLVCLQIIQVRLDDKVVLSTKVVSKLINLRRLAIKQGKFRDKTPVGFGKLCIPQLRSVNFSKWLSPLTNIIEIFLKYCEGFKYLPPLEGLPFLKSLYLGGLQDLEYIYYELPIHEPFFPSLNKLEIWNCSKLVGWKRKGDDFNDINTSSHHLFLPQFPCLSFFEFSYCPMLTHMPTCPNIKKLLLLQMVLSTWEETPNIAPSQCSLSCTPLSLQINVDLKNVSQYWWQNLTSLENLEFMYFSSQQFQAIEIWLFKEDFNYLPSLRNIEFFDCSHIKALPDWICKISSLQHIKISYCGELVLLPEGMTRLTNLHTLEIIGCRLLIEEYEKETSATRATIAHIPNIIIKK
ncbi:putative disease resistance protein RGA1 [Trifolium pratense]|uniref:putative disease resistance protein RGA1 n=1 Tax=Trifolium pratense TaxID=57577 RepID=UPI001E694AE1|nr:putative disease resistance protein RGA1 [Trifolium pratense]XP_045787548.1 putative disease resistance protein RGA1 [Trifolium pratense]XP_045787550.1 putative disease resistance protein RGA1 [Trifolium pratense]XP_045787551.1 putative disease resistance protein RGA1 [Trifolium pratense]XP_045787552.1 putative disease resistance protein RGA1 [Trifolium pratense]XP_045787553.1 putative disease resistance protein RGA1 [Trifolium pratense]XP_045787554.1 putative disease resistance protein RG